MVELALGIVIGVVTAVAFAVVAVLILGGRRAGGIKAALHADPTDFTFDAELMKQVQALTVGGDKAAAITLLRDQTPDLPLPTATLIVDRLELAARRRATDGRTAAAPPPPSARSAGPAPFDIAPVEHVDFAPEPAPASQAGGPSASPVPLELELEARGLKAAGRSAAAVELVHEGAGLEWPAAAEYVAAL